MYDINQLNQDLETIACRMGRYVSRGFYTESVYEDDTISIVDRFTDPQGPDIFLKENDSWVKLDKPFNTNCFAGERILSLVVAIEDRHLK